MTAKPGTEPITGCLSGRITVVYPKFIRVTKILIMRGTNERQERQALLATDRIEMVSTAANIGEAVIILRTDRYHPTDNGISVKESVEEIERKLAPLFSISE